MRFLGVVLVLVLLLTGCTSKEYAPGMISIAFDDGTAVQFTHAYPVLRQYDYPATVYVITQLVGSSFEGQPLMTWNQVAILDAAGWEIGSHSATHPYLTELAADDLLMQLRMARLDLQSRGYSAVGFGYPYGDYSSQTDLAVQELHGYARTSDVGLNNLSAVDKYHLRIRYLTNETTLAQVQGWIDEVDHEDDWLILMFHIVDDAATSEYAVTTTQFAGIIDYIDEKHIPVQTVAEVLGHDD